MRYSLIFRIPNRYRRVEEVEAVPWSNRGSYFELLEQNQETANKTEVGYCVKQKAKHRQASIVFQRTR